MILGENVESVYSVGREIQRVFSYGKLVWEKGDIDYSVRPFTVKAVDEKVSITFKLRSYNYCTYFKYSINGGEWVDNAGEFLSIVLKKNERVSIKSTTRDIYYCNISGLADVYGNIMSLIYGDDFIGKTVWERDYSVSPATYPIGFFDESDIRSAENLVLPATTLANACYEKMFLNCTSLTIAPKLPATKLSTRCYWGMFQGCTSLTTAPELPATKLYNRCYSNMFDGCTSLTTAPTLPATTLATYCYYAMFGGCTSLTTAPELPATRLAAYCYYYMFFRCANLNYIKCYANVIGDSIEGWTTGVSSTGTLVCDRTASQTLKGYIPSTWTVEYLN